MGCQVYCITLLAHDAEAMQTWFWNGFGIAVVDAVRPLQPLQPLELARLFPLEIRTAAPEDAEALAALDVEHRRHYSLPPILMAPRPSEDTNAVRRFLATADNSIWMALDGNVPVGFIRCAAPQDEGADIVQSAGTVFINGAYVRPDYRGQGAMPAMLDAVLRAYAQRGYARVALDFESFNPEAAAFWPRYFQPVCFSLMRVPES